MRFPKNNQMGRFDFFSRSKAIFLAMVLTYALTAMQIFANVGGNAKAGHLSGVDYYNDDAIITLEQVCWENHGSIRIFGKKGDEKLGIFEFGVKGGISQSFTDIQRNKNLGFFEAVKGVFENTGYNAGVYINYRHVNHFGIGAGLNVIGISGLALSPNNEQIGADDVVAGFYFENQIFEFNGRLMFYAPIPTQRVFDVYAFFGLSVFYNILELRDQNQLVRPPTEDFSKLQMALPFGVGVSLRVGRIGSIGFESGYRYTPFNFLDGKSPPDTRYDAFLLNQVKLGIFLN